MYICDIKQRILVERGVKPLFVITTKGGRVKHILLSHSCLSVVVSN